MTRKGTAFSEFVWEMGDIPVRKAHAVKRVLVHQITAAMKERGVTKAELAKRLRMSASRLDRLLDPVNDDVSLAALARAAAALGRSIRLELV